MERTAAQLRSRIRGRCQLELPEGLAEGLILELGRRGERGADTGAIPGEASNHQGVSQLVYTTQHHSMLPCMRCYLSLQLRNELSVTQKVCRMEALYVLALMHV